MLRLRRTRPAGGAKAPFDDAASPRRDPYPTRSGKARALSLGEDAKSPEPSAPGFSAWPRDAILGFGPAGAAMRRRAKISRGNLRGLTLMLAAPRTGGGQ